MPIDFSNIGYGQGVLPANTKNWTDTNTNEILATALSTFSTLTATNHNFSGATPNAAAIIQTSGTAAAMVVGTFTATQYTPAGTANPCTVLVYRG